MANVKISNLTAATTPLAGTEVLPIVQSGATVKASIANVQTAVYPGGTANGVAYLNGSKVLTTGSALVFDGSNLGVGVTPSAWTTLTAIQNKNSSWYGFGNEGGLYANAYYASGSWRYIATAAATGYDSNGAAGQHRWYNAPSGTAGNAITFTQAMTLDASGRLGLGTTSPTTPLQIQTAAATGVNSIFCTGSTTSYNFWTISNTSGNARIGVDSSSGGALATGSSAYSTVIGSANATPLHLISNGAVQATIDTSGTLLLGSSPGASEAWISLKNNFATKPAINVFGNTAGDASNSGITISKYDNSSATTQILIRFVTNAGANGSGQINANGANSAAFGTFSDRRLKENIVDLPPQLANIMALRPVEYDYIESEGGGHQIGFIAQEVQAIYSDLVGERTDGMLTLSDMNKNDARLIKAMQEMKALIDTQALTITTLTARITALESA